MASRIESWVNEVAALTKPQNIHWCDGSDAENATLIEQMLGNGTLHRLNHKEYPGCYLHRSHINDVARTEHLTFICSKSKDEAGPTNNWLDPNDAKAKVRPLFDGAMRCRTMYVIPYLMGPAGSPFSKVGVEVTDSPYVVVNMRIMARIGTVALEELKRDPELDHDIVFGMHSLGDLSPDRRYILHFPEEDLIWSVGSGYGGNALLGKKCFALRLASVLARQEGWMAEHMLIMELEEPSGEKTYIAAALPSACGKTNLAMLIPPQEFASKGYKVRTLGDDIAWLRVGKDGRLWAVNPEAGFFGVVPGTGPDTNPNALATIRSNTIFTNVAVTPDGVPWWEGKANPLPSNLLDWKGQPWDGKEKAAHPNSRFTAPARQCPSISPSWQDPQGVPISAFIFGSRRSSTMPLVVQSSSWQHGVFMASSMGSETTAAAVGQAGVVRRDPFAMLPFCGYNMADYFSHWLKMGEKIKNPPGIFLVNWFRKGADGKFLWPGFGENLRVLLWVLDRVRGKGKAVQTELGAMPTPDALNLDGLNLSRDTIEQLLRVSKDEWKTETDNQKTFYDGFGVRVPQGIRQEFDALRKRLG
jgi:phosphoenolpyruvate carboxykinase (GTP)